MVFYTEAIPLSQQGQMSNVWLMAHFQKRLNKRQIKKTKVSDACNSLIKPSQPIALRHYGQCLLGLSRIHLKQVEYLHADCNDAIAKLKIKIKKSNVDLPGNGEGKSKDNITLGNVNDGDNTLIDLNTNNIGGISNENVNDENDQFSDLANTLNLGNMLDTGSGSHGLGMLGTSTMDNINNIDNVSLSGFGSNLSKIDNMNLLNQYQAKSHEITLNENGSHIGSDLNSHSRIGHMSSLCGNNNELAYQDTQECDIEIDFGDNENEIEFDENDAQSVEAGRAMIDIDNQMNSINISNVNDNDNNGMIEQLSAIKGPKPDIDMGSVSDVASVASVASGESIPDNLSHHSNENENKNENIVHAPLDESMGLPLDDGVAIPAPMEINVTDDDNDSVASIASVGGVSIESGGSLSTTDLEQQRQRKRQKLMRTDNESDADTDNENQLENENNNDDIELERSKHSKPSKPIKPQRRYKRSRKPRFAEEVSANGEIEIDHNADKNGVRDSYILQERDILHIWRERRVSDLEFEDMMKYPISMADQLFGGGFAANYGNVTREFDRFMPKYVLDTYNNILKQKPVEQEAPRSLSENLNDSRTQDDMLGDMFNPDIEIGRNIDNENDNRSFNINEMQDNNISPLINNNASSMMMRQDESHQESFMKQKKLDFDESSIANLNVTVLDTLVDDNFDIIPQSMIDVNGSHCATEVASVSEDTLNAQLQVNIEDEVDDIDIDIDVTTVTKYSNENENKNEKENRNNNNEDIKDENENKNEENKESQQSDRNIKFRSWSRRTQKTLNYLDSKDGNTFSFNEMMQESNKRETVAGVFYEMLVLKNADLVELKQDQCFGDIAVSKTAQFEEYARKVRMVRMSQV